MLSPEKRRILYYPLWMQPVRITDKEGPPQRAEPRVPGSSTSGTELGPN